MLIGFSYDLHRFFGWKWLILHRHLLDHCWLIHPRLWSKLLLLEPWLLIHHRKLLLEPWLLILHRKLLLEHWLLSHHRNLLLEHWLLNHRWSNLQLAGHIHLLLHPPLCSNILHPTHRIYLVHHILMQLHYLLRILSRMPSLFSILLLQMSTFLNNSDYTDYNARDRTYKTTNDQANLDYLPFIFFILFSSSRLLLFFLLGPCQFFIFQVFRALAIAFFSSFSRGM